MLKTRMKVLPSAICYIRKFFNFGSMWAMQEARDRQHVGELNSNNWKGKANKPILSKAWNINPTMIFQKPKWKYVGILQSKSQVFNFGSMCARREARDKQRVGELVSNDWNEKANKQILWKHEIWKYVGSIQSESQFFDFGSMWIGREARDKQHVSELVSNNWNRKANKPISTF